MSPYHITVKAGLICFKCFVPNWIKPRRGQASFLVSQKEDISYRLYCTKSSFTAFLYPQLFQCFLFYLCDQFLEVYLEAVDALLSVLPRKTTVGGCPRRWVWSRARNRPSRIQASAPPPGESTLYRTRKKAERAKIISGPQFWPKIVVKLGAVE